jgi:RNA polymerase sigma-70 factor (ECF subfamily)
LKTITFYNIENVLIKKAAAAHPGAQKWLYEKYAPKMLSVCRQYIKDMHYAEDVMIKGFLKVFSHLKTYRYEGSFEGWMRKIMVREAITHLRKKQLVIFDDELREQNSNSQIVLSSALDVEYIQLLIDALPEGYKMVFMLYAVEGYSHNEIAAMLNISESTSKTQLFKARRRLQEQLKEQNIEEYGTH